MRADEPAVHVHPGLPVDRAKVKDAAVRPIPTLRAQGSAVHQLAPAPHAPRHPGEGALDREGHEDLLPVALRGGRGRPVRRSLHLEVPKPVQVLPPPGPTKLGPRVVIRGGHVRRGHPLAPLRQQRGGRPGLVPGVQNGLEVLRRGGGGGEKEWCGGLPRKKGCRCINERASPARVLCGVEHLPLDLRHRVAAHEKGEDENKEGQERGLPPLLPLLLHRPGAGGAPRLGLRRRGGSEGHDLSGAAAREDPQEEVPRSSRDGGRLQDALLGLVSLHQGDLLAVALHDVHGLRGRRRGRGRVDRLALLEVGEGEVRSAVLQGRTGVGCRLARRRRRRGARGGRVLHIARSV
mmetsp:Transcript_12122/g.36796  ORF Transcript_12122/g.36796 Transcript_12122/m.36796 type:complete len:349 (+) Transcript_12122:1584-2630(+)